MMNGSEFFIILCFAVSGIGILISLLVRERLIPTLLAAFAILASLCGLIAGGLGLSEGAICNFSLWTLPNLGVLQFASDRLSALFIVLSGIILILVSFFSNEYLKAYIGRINLKAFSLSYLALLMSIIAILISADVFSFLIAWESMSILSYLLVNTGCKRDDARQAGYLMLAIGEAGTLAIALAFIILANMAGSTSFSAIKSVVPHLTPGLRLTVFFLSFFGFATKVGLVPVNFWLPRAYAVAPANISALFSGLTVNLGIYGILRVDFDLLNTVTSGAGIVVLIVGVISSLVGILYATIENDFKKILAHSSIENMGIISVGLGASLIFRSMGHPVYAAIALIAALYHVINHSMYKSLLFMGAGNLDIQVDDRNLDHLGGLIKRLPWTALFVLVGTLSISAIPPFNGFVSEWLMLQSLLRSVELNSLSIKIVFVAAGVGLTLTAGLAVTAFVRFFAMTFLGMPRSKAVQGACEMRRSALIPMAFLSIACLTLGVLPTYVIPALDLTVAPLTGASGTNALIPPFFNNHAAHQNQLPRRFVAEFHSLGAQVGQKILPGRGLVLIHRGGEHNPVVFAMSTSYMFAALILLLVLTVGVLWFFVSRRRKVERQPRWDGGVRRFLPEMTYTATGFAQPVRVSLKLFCVPR